MTLRELLTAIVAHRPSCAPTAGTIRFLSAAWIRT